MPRDDRSADDRRQRGSNAAEERRLMRSTNRLDIPRELRRTIALRSAYDACRLSASVRKMNGYWSKRTLSGAKMFQPTQNRIVAVM